MKAFIINKYSSFDELKIAEVETLERSVICNVDPQIRI